MEAIISGKFSPAMNLHRLQEEANRLLSLYNNAIRAVQNDTGGEDVVELLESKCDEIKACRDGLMKLLEDSERLRKAEDSESVVEDGRNFVSDTLYFIDKLLS